MKKLIVFAVFLSLFAVACASPSPSVTVSVKITVNDSETGFSGVVYENSSYKYVLGSPTVDGVLSSLAGKKAISYIFDGSFVKINDFGYFDSPDFSYSRGWVVYINGTPSDKGARKEITEGDRIEIVYELFNH
ncbi:MAG: DUF4430 domain-containing protein [Clostridiales bacterium]|jgi:hypothetical protein|nr:DUF4430 domain-containing protein [Clostridiales bacterium]